MWNEWRDREREIENEREVEKQVFFFFFKWISKLFKSVDFKGFLDLPSKSI